MSESSARLALPFLMPSQAQKHVTHNEALSRLDLLVQLAVEEFDAVIPPGLPEEGQVWALGAGPQGGWAGHDYQLAAWFNGAWLFETLEQGRSAIGKDNGDLRVWTGSEWDTPPLPDLSMIDGVGINTVYGATNRLAVSAPATLLNHEGAGHQLKINKAATGETASLLFQSNWSGRAEMGLNGGDDFSIKVSSDGSGWTQALKVDSGNGTVTGAAVQNAKDDDTPGKLMTVGAFGLGGEAPKLAAADDYDDAPMGFVGNQNGLLPANAPGSGSWAGFSTSCNVNVGLQVLASGSTQDLYHRARDAANSWASWRRVVDTENLVGTVSQSGGVPTGAVIEQGSNANGQYLRFADGTQICSQTITTGTGSAETWTYPVAFTSAANSVQLTPHSASAALATAESAGSATSIDINGWNTSGARVAIDVSAMAIGRWY